MIRGALVHAKSAQVAGEYQREVVSLGQARARDGHAREKVRDREERFWRAIAHASTVTAGKVTRGGAHSVALSRALQAHHDLSKATGEHRKVAGEVQHQIARVMKAKCVLSAFERARAKERAIRAHKSAERLGEEALEVSLARRVSLTGRRAERAPHDSVRDERSRREMPSRDGYPPVVSPVYVTSHCAETRSHDAVEAHRYRPETIAVSLQGVESEEGKNGAALLMRMESGGAPIACRLETSAPGRVGIVMEAASPSLVRTLEGERYGIMRRLSESGITIGGFEVRRDLAMRGALSGFLRRARQPREEDDENVIA
jgi:hypothetical protein